MRKSILAAAAIAALALSPSLPAFAKGHGGGSAGGHTSHFARPPGFSHGNKVGWGKGHVPPGWSHGRKVGWGKGHVPPGLARNEHGDRGDHEGHGD